MKPCPSHRSTWFRIALVAVFVLAMFMGAGPGVYLINPSADGPPAKILGLPIVYAWCLIWFAVQVTVIWIAATTIWRYADRDES